MPEASVVSIPAEDVPTFRELVLAEFFGLAGQIPESGHEEDRLGHAELVDEYTRIIDRLGWDGPTRTDTAIPVRSDFLAGVLEGAVESCLADLSRGRSEARRDAARRLLACARLVCRLEGVD